ncbi:MAG: xylan 1,4-beta-xylosidase [Lachnospiraceae bacterium]|nr:xylan 1,4-beta-xylosidase [Lachnospiraceae bacterium]
MAETIIISVHDGDRADFHNQVDYCIGTGRMSLALHKEYHDQLKLVQEHIGFKHIRGHGLFTDDMAIYQEFRQDFFNPDSPYEVEYNFTYLDRVMDDYRSMGLDPFLELGFMPKKMASGEQTIFYWKGNTTPPKSYEAWKDLVQALLRHLLERYGEDALSFPIEVWNEPNLPGFWYKADMDEYFKLFKESFEAIKAVDERFRVGGPAVCGGTDEKWISAFMEFCHNNSLPIDFVTRHHYTTELPERTGHYGYAELMDDEAGFKNLHSTREIIDRYPEYKGLPIHITEFNTSYIPNCPLHDTNQNAAYIAKQLSRLGDDNESYSYWTFGDVFEEMGVPFTPFHGGFGLVANGCIPKPTFWSFAFFKALKKKEGVCVHKSDNGVIMKYEDGSFRGVLFNATRQREGKDLNVSLELEAGEAEYSLVEKRVDEESCNPLKLWHSIGEPANPDEEIISLLKSAAYPAVSGSRLQSKDGRVSFELPLAENALVYFELTPSVVKADRGYDYERVMQHTH